MKSIRDFLEGKIRRTESTEVLSLEAGATPHPTLGAHDATLVGPRGALAFFEHGVVLAGGAEVRYEDLERVVLGPVREGEAGGPERPVDLVLRGELGTKRLTSSPLGGEVVHAALRWIGNTRLRRKLSD